MQIENAMDFTADNTQFRFFDDRGIEWAGRSTSFRCQNNEIRVSGIVGRGPRAWVEKMVNITHSLSNAKLIVSEVE